MDLRDAGRRALAGHIGLDGEHAGAGWGRAWGIEACGLAIVECQARARSRSTTSGLVFTRNRSAWLPISTRLATRAGPARAALQRGGEPAGRGEEDGEAGRVAGAADDLAAEAGEGSRRPRASARAGRRRARRRARRHRRAASRSRRPGYRPGGPALDEGQAGDHLGPALSGEAPPPGPRRRRPGRGGRCRDRRARRPRPRSPQRRSGG